MPKKYGRNLKVSWMPKSCISSLDLFVVTNFSQKNKWCWNDFLCVVYMFVSNMFVLFWLFSLEPLQGRSWLCIMFKLTSLYMSNVWIFWCPCDSNCSLSGHLSATSHGGDSMVWDSKPLTKRGEGELFRFGGFDFLFVTFTWGNRPIWLIFAKWFETTN